MALGLPAKLTSLLNSWSKSEIGLHDKSGSNVVISGAALPPSAVALGDLLNTALSAPQVTSATLTVSATAGLVGNTLLAATLPLGAKITRVWTDVTTSLTSGGLATVAISAGSTALVTATAFDDSSLVGFDAHSLTPVKLAAASQLKVTVAVAALTAGVMTVYVEWIP